MNAAYSIKKFIFLISFQKIEHNVQLNSNWSTKQIEFKPPDKHTNKLLSFWTLNVFSNNNRHLYSIFLNKQPSQIASLLYNRIARLVEHFLQYFFISHPTYYYFAHPFYYFAHPFLQHSSPVDASFPSLIIFIYCFILASSS